MTYAELIEGLRKAKTDVVFDNPSHGDAIDAVEFAIDYFEANEDDIHELLEGDN